MTLQVVPDATTQLDPDGGFYMPINCRSCGGGYVVEATTRGREDLAFPCDELKQVLYCPQCRKRRMLHILIHDVTSEARPSQRWDKR